MVKKKEIAFCINEFNPANSAYVILSLEEVELDELGKIHFLPRDRLLYPSTLESLARVEERPLLAQLLQEERKVSRTFGEMAGQETQSFNQVRLPASSWNAVIKPLAASKKLFFKRKRLVVDLFRKACFSYVLEQVEPEGLKIAGKLKLGELHWTLQDCELISLSAPYWYIKGGQLGFIEENTPGKWFKGLLQNKILTLVGNEVERFLKYADEEEDFPGLEWEGKKSSLSHLSPKDPLPCLKLTDRLGGFATLWMDYGNGQLIAFKEQELLVTHRKIESYRNPTAEKGWESDLLETDFQFKPCDSSDYYCPLNKVSKSLAFLLECGWCILDAKGRKVMRQKDIQLFMEKGREAILVKGKVIYEQFEASLTDFVGAFNRREHFVQLSVDAVGLISTDSAEPGIASLIEGELASGGIKFKPFQIGLLEALWTGEKGRGAAALDRSLELLRQRLNFHSSEDFAPSELFQGSLRPYQQLGVNWLSLLWEMGLGGVLADEMGLGKTVQVLAFLSRLMEEGTHLIIAPTSLLFHWKREIERFLPSVQVLSHWGEQRLTSLDGLSNTIVLTSYNLLRLNPQIFASRSFNCIICDEAQIIKNPQTQVAQAIFQLQAGCRLCLTGTPIENRFSDLWSPFHFLLPSLLGSYNDFQKSVGSAMVDERHLKLIKRKMRPFMLRRSKKEVAKDLPEKIEQIVWVEMSSDQRIFYENFLVSARQGVLKKIQLDGVQKHRMEIFETLLRLRQICCHPLLVQSLIGEESTLSRSGKWDALMDELDSLIGQKSKVLIYSQFTSMLGYMRVRILEKQWKMAYLDGQTKDREAVVRQFQEDEETQIFLISLKAGGVGINLTAADYVFIFDPWWNDAVENQAIDRAHRIGRSSPVVAKRYITVQSIEEKMVKLKKHKSDLTKGLWEGEGESNLFNFDEKEIEFLLS